MDKKLIIHETNPHGNGKIIYNGEVLDYFYEDGANMVAAVELLLDIGFITPDEVEIYEEDEIYNVFMKGSN